ncbi:MAG: rhodanese-like domain-containing protein [Saprospiraceae bacterium]|nr:rhodanese-like domain-containing protein [Saprospiraceae bacterium]
MKNVFLVLIVLTLQISSFGQKSNELSKTQKGSIESFYLDVDKLTAKRIIAENKKLIIMDVRTPEETAKGKIENAIELDIKSPDFKKKLDQLDKDKPYLVYCYAGGRASNAMDIMKEKGFKQIFILDPGYKDWGTK